MLKDQIDLLSAGNANDVPGHSPSTFVEHLITNKLAAGRARDLGDVDELRKFARNS